MPKEIIDYTNTIIYKIICKDSNVKYFYVGHTTNFTKRKYQHKLHCNSGKKLDIYNIIRSNGGWDNWDMIEIIKCNCNNAIEAKTKENEQYLILEKQMSDVFVSTNKINENNQKIYLCEKCNKEYQDKSGLWRHKKKCNANDNDKNRENIIINHFENDEKDDKDENDIENDISTKELILLLFKQNKELQQSLIDMSKQSSSITNNNNINSNNKTFNLQVFLNETCKDAMNISDFVESIKLQVSDLENVGKVGYIEGISNIIIKNLQALEVEKRPIHCTDQKREVMYVKDGNIWEKEDETNKKVRKLVRSVAHKNICMLKAFRDKYPDCEQYESRRSSQYNKLVIEAMGGKGDDDYEKNTKIIKKIAKAVGIDKS